MIYCLAHGESHADADSHEDIDQAPAIVNALLHRELAKRQDVDPPTLNFLLFGDLDGDDQQDAVVLYSHGVGEFGGDAYSQRIGVLIYRGSRFELVFHERVGQKGHRVFEVGRALGNVVELSGQSWRPGDPACCPSGRTNAKFGWDGARLVEL